MIFDMVWVSSAVRCKTNRYQLRYITSELKTLLGASPVTLEHVRWAYLVPWKTAEQRDEGFATQKRLQTQHPDSLCIQHMHI